jgi:hypothetical protein
MRRHFQRFWIVFFILLGIGFSSTSAQAQTDVPSVAQKAANFLASKLPAPFPGIESYSFAPEIFPDAGLGCPAPGQTFAPQPTSGYRFRFTVKGVVYEVHTNQDGSSAVLCNDPNSSPKNNVALSIFRSPLFSLGYPDSWIVTPRSNGEFFIGQSAQQVCAQPGMVVNQLEKLAAGKTPSSLIDDYLAANKGQTPSGEREVIARTGQSVLLTGSCGDGTPRTFRLSAYVAFGTGYRLLQYAATPQFGQWGDVFRQIADQFSPTNATGSTVIVTEPDGAPPTLFLHRSGGNLYAAAVNDLPGTPITRDADLFFTKRRYLTPRLSADGRQALLIDPSRQALILVGIEKQPRGVILANDAAESLYAPAWSPDGKQTLYISTETPPNLRAVGIDGKNNRVIAKLDGGLCAPKPNADPAQNALSEDRQATLLLEWTAPDTILMSRACNGLGVLKLNPADGVGSALPQLIAYPRLSPDKKRLVGSLIGKLSVYDLTTGAVNIFDPSIDLAVWGADGSTIFYATRTPTQPLKLESATAGYAPFESAVNQLTLHRFDPATKTDTLLFQGEGFAIGSIAPNANGIAFTVIQSSAALLDGLGRTMNAAELQKLAPVAQLYWLPNGAPTPTLLADTYSPQFGPPGSVATIGLPVAPRPTQVK